MAQKLENFQAKMRMNRSGIKRKPRRVFRHLTQLERRNKQEFGRQNKMVRISMRVSRNSFFSLYFFLTPLLMDSRRKGLRNKESSMSPAAADEDMGEDEFLPKRSAVPPPLEVPEDVEGTELLLALLLFPVDGDTS